jgi:hypothetical protein
LTPSWCMALDGRTTQMHSMILPQSPSLPRICTGCSCPQSLRRKITLAPQLQWTLYLKTFKLKISRKMWKNTILNEINDASYKCANSQCGISYTISHFEKSYTIIYNLEICSSKHKWFQIEIGHVCVDNMQNFLILKTFIFFLFFFSKEITQARDPNIFHRW